MIDTANTSARLAWWCLALLGMLFMAGPGVAQTAQTDQATAVETVDWTVWPLPGAINVIDGKPTDGVAMDILRLIMAKLPAYTPNYRLGNRLRQQQDMQQGQNFCSAPLFRRSDSDEYGYFIPFMASTPIQLVIRGSDATQFPIENGTISLVDLAARDDLRGGYSGFRTYPPAVSRWLEQAREDGRVERATGTPSGENVLRMVSQGRIDFAFEFSTLSNTVNKRLRSGEPLVSVPIKGHQALVDAGIYCSRTPWGKRVASELDRAIRELSRNPSTLLTLYQPWIPDETFEVFKDDLRAYYIRRSSEPAVIH